MRRLKTAEEYKMVALRNQEKLKRRIEMGYINGTMSHGLFFESKPKGIQNWYDTRTLINLVSEAFVRNESWSGKRQCFINGKWQLQIRGNTFVDY